MEKVPIEVKELREEVMSVINDFRKNNTDLWLSLSEYQRNLLLRKQEKISFLLFGLKTEDKYVSYKAIKGIFIPNITKDD